MYPRLVSVIITTHNRRELVQRAINSVFEQTYPNIELIVVDDHSEDGTSDACKDSRINYVYISKEDSLGNNYARNVGITASKGEYCAFLDDDDYWLPTKIEKQVALLEQRNCELVYCGRKKEIVKENGIEFRDVLPVVDNCGDMRRMILYKICTTTSCLLIKRKALIEIGMFDINLRFWQEYELTIRLAQRGPFYFVREALCVYRVDTRDKNRLTNKYYAWRDAVKYIQMKHAVLFAQLRFVEKYKVKNLVWRDAAVRCHNSGLKVKYYLYYTLTLPYKLGIKMHLIK